MSAGRDAVPAGGSPSVDGGGRSPRHRAARSGTRDQLDGDPPSNREADRPDDDPSSNPPDYRLVPAAIAAWVVAFVALGWPAWASFTVAVGCALAVPPVLVCRRGPVAVVAIALVFGGLAAFLTGIQVRARDGSPLRHLAVEGATVTVRLAVSDDPRPLRSRGIDGSARVAVRASVERVEAGGHAWSGGGDILVVASAEGWRGLLPSQHAVVTGRLGRAAGSDLTVAVLYPRGRPVEVSAPSPPQRVAGRLRDGLRRASKVLPPDTRGLLPGLVVGDTSGVDAATAADFDAAGLTHLLAVSGSNLVIIVGAVVLPLRRRHADPRLIAVLGGLALVGFVILVRPSESVVRAAVMSGIGLLALAVGRSRALPPALAGTVLILILVSPGLARAPGFALSVVATGALVVVAPPLARAMSGFGVPSALAIAVALPVAAGVATAPIVAALSGRVSLVSFTANLLAEPAVAPATVLGVLATLVAPVSTGAASGLAWLAGFPVAWIASVARICAGQSLAELPWPAGMRGAMVMLVVLVVLAHLFRRRARWVLAACVALALIAVPVRVMSGRWPPSGWLFAACDVGQGDALAVHIGTDSALVVDAGPDPAAVDQCLRALRIGRVPLVVLTHLHADHVAGLSGVLRGRAVGGVEVGPLEEPAEAWRTVVRIATARRIPILRSTAGEVRAVSTDVRFQVLAPAKPFRGTNSDPNNSSIVLRVTAHGHVLLLTGDVEVDAQRALTRSGADIRAEVLKVPHHGSSAQLPEFLAATGARIAIVSVGADNDYGHPAPGVLRDLTALGARVYRTDHDGDIVVTEAHGELAVETRERSPPTGRTPNQGRAGGGEGEGRERWSRDRMVVVGGRVPPRPGHPATSCHHDLRDGIDPNRSHPRHRRGGVAQRPRDRRGHHPGEATGPGL